MHKEGAFQKPLFGVLRISSLVQVQTMKEETAHVVVAWRSVLEIGMYTI